MNTRRFILMMKMALHDHITSYLLHSSTSTTCLQDHRHSAAVFARLSCPK